MRRKPPGTFSVVCMNFKHRNLSEQCFLFLLLDSLVFILFQNRISIEVLFCWDSSLLRSERSLPFLIFTPWVQSCVSSLYWLVRCSILLDTSSLRFHSITCMEKVKLFAKLFSTNLRLNPFTDFCPFVDPVPYARPEVKFRVKHCTGKLCFWTVPNINSCIPNLVQ